MNVYSPSLRLSLRALSSLVRLKVAHWTQYRLVPRPLVMVWESTLRCNSQCTYCDSWRRPATDQDMLREDEIQEIIRSSLRMGLSGLVVTGGGEPLLREDVFRVISYAKQLGLWVALTTNGTLISEENIHNILQVDLVTLSIDGVDKKKYSLTRGPFGYEQAMKAVELLRRDATHTYLTVQAVIQENNWRDINTINEHFFDKGFDTVFQLVYNQRFRIDEEEWEERVDRLRYHRALTALMHRRFLRKFPEIAGGTAAFPCMAGSSNFAVSPRGRLKACNTTLEPNIDLRAIPIDLAWRQMRPIRQYVSGPRRECLCGNTCFVPISLLLLGR